MAGAEGVEPLVVGQGFAEPRGSLLNGAALSREDFFQLIARGGVIFFVRVRQNAVGASCARAPICQLRGTRGKDTSPLAGWKPALRLLKQLDTLKRTGLREVRSNPVGCLNPGISQCHRRGARQRRQPRSLDSDR